MGDEIGELPEFDFDLDISEPSFEEQTGTTSGPVVDDAPAGNGNPAWDAILNEIPREFHSKVMPTLSAWDNGVKSQFEKRAQEFQQFQQQYQPWQELQQQGRTPQELLQAYTLMERINQDPRGFYDQMANLLRQRGLLEEAQQVEELAFEEQGQEPQVVEDPRIAQLQQQQERLIQFLAMQENASRQAQAQAEMDFRIQSDMESLEARTGKLPDWVRDEVIDRAIRMTESQKREVSLSEAYMDFQRVRQQMLSTPRPGQQAPRVIPGGGGYPQQPRDPEALKTSEGRAAAIQAIIQRNS